MPFIAGAAILGGAALSAGGSAAAASSANTGNRKVRDYQMTQNALNLYQTARRIFGDGRRALEETLGRLPGGIRERFIREQFGLSDDETNDLEWMTPQALVDHVERKYPGSMTGQNRGLLGQQDALRQTVGNRQQEIGRGYDRGTGQLMGLATGAEGIARQFGAGGERLLRDQSAADLATANRTSRAALNASGFGNSTLVGNQLSSNQTNYGRRLGQDILGLRGATTDRVLAARGQTIGMLNDRLSGRTAMSNDFLGRDIALRQTPINTELGLLTGGLFNVGVDFQPSGESALGAAAVTGGNALAGYGAYRSMQRPQGNQSGVTPAPYQYGSAPPQGSVPSGFLGMNSVTQPLPWWRQR